MHAKNGVNSAPYIPHMHTAVGMRAIYDHSIHACSHVQSQSMMQFLMTVNQIRRYINDKVECIKNRIMTAACNWQD